MAASGLALFQPEVLAIAEWARQTPRISEIRIVGKPPRTRRPIKCDIGLAVAVSGAGTEGSGFGIFCSLAGHWQKQLEQRIGRRVSLWWFGPESPIYEYLVADGVLIW